MIYMKYFLIGNLDQKVYIEVDDNLTVNSNDNHILKPIQIDSKLVCEKNKILYIIFKKKVFFPYEGSLEHDKLINNNILIDKTY